MIKAIYKSIKNSFICFVIIFGLIIFPYQQIKVSDKDELIRLSRYVRNIMSINQ